MSKCSEDQEVEGGLEEPLLSSEVECSADIISPQEPATSAVAEQENNHVEAIEFVPRLPREVHLGRHHTGARIALTGGVWGTTVYYGDYSMASCCICCLCCGLLPGAVFSCLPFDKRRVYRVGGQFYEASGDPIGCRIVNFKPEEEEFGDTMDTDMCMIACLVSGLLGLICGTLYFIILHTTSLPPENTVRG